MEIRRRHEAEAPKKALGREYCVTDMAIRHS